MREPASLTLPAIQQAFRDAWKELSWLLNGQLDWSGRRLQKIGNAAVGDDALPLGQAKGLFLPIDTDLTKLLLSTGGDVRIDTFANRGLAGAYRFKLFSASDRNYVTWLSDGSAWRYVFGAQQRTQAQLSTLAGTLTTADVGYIADVTDYLHFLRWSGSAWAFNSSDPGSGFVAMGKPTGAAPSGGLWGLCDGTAYNCLNGDGTLTSLTSQNLTGEVFLKGSTATAAQQAAARAKWESSAVTDNESAHTHAVGTYTANLSGTGISLDGHSSASDTTVTGEIGRAHV